MNPERIYGQYRDEALAHQITAAEYETFVAMPFSEKFSYRSSDVFEKVICSAAAEATREGRAQRAFGKPRRIDETPGVAGVITEDILVAILEAHFFVADLTGANPGVLLETGVAFGLKSNRQIILIMQGDPRDLHFDIRNNRITTYDTDRGLVKISQAFLAAAESFEAHAAKRLAAVTRQLSPDAVYVLNVMGRFMESGGKDAPLYFGSFAETEHKPPWDDVRVRFELATRELLERGLLWDNYKPSGAGEKVDVYGLHPTELGRAVISRLWPGLTTEG